MLIVRKMQASDADVLGQIMFDAIRSGPSRYTEAQRSAWQAQPKSGAKWVARLNAQSVWVADGPDGPIGFISLDKAGYIDLAFVRPAVQDMGVFSTLYAALEAGASASGLVRLSTHASLMAQPAFEAKGFHVMRHETVDRCGEVLARAEMEKTLT